MAQMGCFMQKKLQEKYLALLSLLTNILVFEAKVIIKHALGLQYMIVNTYFKKISPSSCGKNVRKKPCPGSPTQTAVPVSGKF
jgi:hypothetical protein